MTASVQVVGGRVDQGYSLAVFGTGVSPMAPAVWESVARTLLEARTQMLEAGARPQNERF